MTSISPDDLNVLLEALRAGIVRQYPSKPPREWVEQVEALITQMESALVLNAVDIHTVHIARAHLFLGHPQVALDTLHAILLPRLTY